MALDQRRRFDQRGSSLIMAIVVMLVLSVLGLSFAILADLESRVSLNHKAAAQAFALAEAGLQHGRNLVSGAYAAGSFNTWVDNAANGSLLTAPVSLLGGGSYQVRIDNDCNTPLAGFVPAPLAVDPGCGAAVGVPPGRDQNEKAILTAWATVTDAAGNARGRARVRAWATLDDPWKHICASNDEPCYSGGGNPTVVPNDPAHENAPATFPVLPTPVLGAHPLMALCAPNWVAAGGTSVMPHYFNAAVRRNATGLAAAPFNDLPAPPAGRTRAGWDGGAGVGCGLVVDNAGGAVWCPGCVGGGTLYINQSYAVGAPQNPVVIYVTGRARFGNNVDTVGTVVVHGDAVAGNNDFSSSPDVCINKNTSTVSCSATSPRNANFPSGEGYPLALLIYNPLQATPPPDQNTEADISDNNVFVSGILYSGGSITFNPIKVDGGVVAHGVEFQSSAASYIYNETYGLASPPPGFTTPAGTAGVKLTPRTYSHCRTYNADTGAPSTCD